jgi:hypothetical protein
MPREDKTRKECRFCSRLKSSLFQGKEYFRCRAQRFDDAYGNPYFARSGIRRPNKTVAAAQKACPFFLPDTRADSIGHKDRQRSD